MPSPLASPTSGWKAEFTLGVPALDDDHERVFSKIGELRRLAFQRGDVWGLRACLSEIMIHVYLHFELEEQLMAVSGYYDLPLHRAEHDEFLAWLGSQRRHLETENVRFGRIAAILDSWFTVHTLAADFKFARRFGTVPAAHPGYHIMEKLERISAQCDDLARRTAAGTSAATGRGALLSTAR